MEASSLEDNECIMNVMRQPFPKKRLIASRMQDARVDLSQQIAFRHLLVMARSHLVTVATC